MCQFLTNKNRETFLDIKITANKITILALEDKLIRYALGFEIKMLFKSWILFKISFNQNIETLIISAMLLQKVIAYYTQPNILLCS